MLTSEYLLRSNLVKHLGPTCCARFFDSVRLPSPPLLEVLHVSDWRIDELAQRAGVAVDTIRYYQREGLLPSGERSGRTRRFGPEHLERLERIRALQSRRFSLAAIHALLERDDPGALAGLLIGSEEATYDHDELLEAAGRRRRLVRDLTDAGLLRDPAEHGRSAYDADDVNVLRSFADLGRLAIPDARARRGGAASTPKGSTRSSAGSSRCSRSSTHTAGTTSTPSVPHDVLAPRWSASRATSA